jgi:heterodisulfide reductase subunit C
MTHKPHTPTSSFTEEIEKIPGGESICKCIQCGICTASCVIANVSDRYRPRNIIQKIILGMREEVLEDENLWFCMTCRMCEERCQEGVSPAEIFLAIRQIAVKEGHVPFVFQNTANTILQDGWMLKDSYSDFIEDEREDLGLDTDLRWNTEFVRKLKERYFSGVE